MSKQTECLERASVLDVGPYTETVSQCRQLAERTSYIESFFVHGSHVIGAQTNYSDLDISFFLYDEESIALLYQELGHILELDSTMVNFFRDDPYDYWHAGGREVGVHTFTVTDVRDRLARIFTTADEFEKLSAWAQHTIRESSSVVAKGTLLSDARMHTEHIPVELRQQLLARYQARIEKRLRWWEKRPFWKNPFDEFSDMTLVIEDVLRWQYALNDMFYMPGAKQYFQEAACMEPNITAELQTLLFIDPVPTGRLKAEKYQSLLLIYQKLLATHPIGKGNDVGTSPPSSGAVAERIRSTAGRESK